MPHINALNITILAAIIATGIDNDRHHVLMVSTAGIVTLVPMTTQHPGIYLATAPEFGVGLICSQGAGMVGPAAARDLRHVALLLGQLRQWTPRSRNESFND